VDGGHGWLIFALPPGEAAFHPSDESGLQELYFMCDDLKAEMTSLAKKGVKCSEVEEARWGSITKMRLPGGGEVGLLDRLAAAPPRLGRTFRTAPASRQILGYQSRCGSKYVNPANPSQWVDVLVNPFSNPASKTRFLRAV
jgi:hypothetical protein